MNDAEKDLIDLSTVHELKLQDQIIYIDPPIEYARYYWLQEFHKLLGSICSLPRLEANRYESNLKDTLRDSPWVSSQEVTYFSVLKKVNQKDIEDAYSKYLIDNLIFLQITSNL